MPDPTAPAPRGLTLGERLRRCIATEGPIDFAAFMAAALYDPEDGFYTRGPRLGAGGAFATAPTAHPAFAEAVLAEARATYDALGCPPDFRVVEAGPGDGTLARALAALPGELVLVERAAGLRDRQAEALAGLDVAWAERAGALAPRPTFLVANELLDALPVHLLEPPDEVCVGLAGGRLAELRRPAPAALLAELETSGVAPRPGGRYAVRPAAAELLAGLAACVARGRLLLVDYGGEGAEVHDGRRPPVRTFVGGQPGGDPLAAPGAQDLTADVDFGALRRAAAALGLRELAYLDQPDWLARHGVHVGPAATRSDDDWRLAGLLDRLLPFRVLLLERA